MVVVGTEKMGEVSLSVFERFSPVSSVPTIYSPSISIRVDSRRRQQTLITIPNLSQGVTGLVRGQTSLVSRLQDSLGEDVHSFRRCVFLLLCGKGWGPSEPDVTNGRSVFFPLPKKTTTGKIKRSLSCPVSERELQSSARRRKSVVTTTKNPGTLVSHRSRKIDTW